MSNQLLLSLKEVIVSYHKKEIFKDLDLIIHRKDFIALVGKNGAGKSTLMNVLTENHEIDNGEIWKIDNLKISYFNQNFFFKQKTAYEIASCLVGSEMCIRDSFKYFFFMITNNYFLK